MNKLKTLAAMAFLFVGMASSAFAQSDQHTVSVEVLAINEIAITGGVTLQISAATAGAAPTDATGSTTYAITTNDNGGSTKITASTNVAPSSLGTGSGVDLKVSAAAPAGAAAGSTDLSLGTTAVDVVTGIEAVSQSGITLGYTLSATAASGQIAATDVTVTYTIVN